MKTESQKLVIPEKIHCRAIQLVDFSIQASDAYRDNPVKHDRLTFSIAKSIAHVPKENKARYRLYFLIEALDVQDQKVGLDASIGIEFHFEIENLTENILEADGQLQINANLAATLLGMAYSTSRGIILEKTQNTFLSGVILPCIDPYAILKEAELDE